MMARLLFLMWQSNGSPRYGFYFNHMKTSRAQFKLALRQCRINEDRLVADSLAKKLLAKDTKKFCDEVKKASNGKLSTVATTIDGVTGTADICEMWHNHFKSLLNSSKDISQKCSILNELNADLEYKCHTYSPYEVKDAIKALKKGKSAGLDDLSSEHFLYAHEKIFLLLSFVFNAMLIHGYVPYRLMDTVIIPLVKDKKGDITDKDNYRPIAITCISSKILELCMLQKYGNVLTTECNQFGFKEKHSTDLCVFVLKEVVNYYASLSSPVYACFLDASKAFDRVNHWHLFDKLLRKGLPKIMVRLLLVWYTTQKFAVKWSNALSEFFKVTNGVRQGGILSPVLFNVFIDDLSQQLKNVHVGCFMNNVCFNHLNYADDCVLLAPSPAGLQRMLNMCQRFSEQYDMSYNIKKTFCMSFMPKGLKLTVPNLYINGKNLTWVSDYKYLGIFLDSHYTDDIDINRQVRSIYARGNMLIRKFRRCSLDVKVQLFKTYCSNIYCGHLWQNYKKASLYRIKVAYNNVFRKLMGYKNISVSQQYVELNINSFDVIMRKMMGGFNTRIQESCNVLVQTLISSQYFIYSSNLAKTWNSMLYIHAKFDF